MGTNAVGAHRGSNDERLGIQTSAGGNRSTGSSPAAPSTSGGVGQVSGPMPASGSISGSQDAFYSANGTTTSASTNLVVQSAAVTMPNSLHYRFTIKLQNLSTLVVSPTLGGRMQFG